MAFELDNVVPWGRSFEEYAAMFALSADDLRGEVLGCGDGPASFNAVASRRGHRVTSVDPLYAFTAEEIATRIAETAQTVAEQTRRNAHEFVWRQFDSVEQLIAARMSAMEAFLQDLPLGSSEGRYVTASLPVLPFDEKRFDLALCSHLLFLYSAQYDVDFHVASIVELARVAREVRVFPLLELGSRPSRHLDDVIGRLASVGLEGRRVRVPYEFQRGGDEMLQVVDAVPSVA